VTTANGFSQNTGTVGTIPLNSTRIVTSPVYSYAGDQTAVYLKYHLTADGNKPTAITGYSITITLDGGAVQTCTSGAVNLPVSDAAGTDYYFSISGITIPANTYFKTALSLTIGSATGSTNNVLLSAFQINGTLAPAGTVLPVKFSAFEAKSLSNGVALNWSVGSEANVNGYTIEKSNDGRSFSKIGFVAADGNNSYSFVDAQGAGAISYYRIRSVDNDGKINFSSIVIMKGGKAAIVLKAFPSPFINKLSVQHGTATAGSLISIAAEDGRILKSVIPALGTQQTDIDLTTAKAGLYLVRYKNGNGQVETLKILKQ
jgi:hypothetical protein